jgi:hypothetical protein
MISAVVFAVVVTVIVIELKKYKRAVGKTRQIDGTDTLQNPLRASGPLSQLRQSIQFAVGHDESYEINRTQRRRASKLPILARVIFHPTKIVISFAQVLAALGPVLHIHLPPFMQVLSEFLRSFISTSVRLSKSIAGNATAGKAASTTTSSGASTYSRFLR